MPSPFAFFEEVRKNHIELEEKLVKIEEKLDWLILNQGSIFTNTIPQVDWYGDGK